MAIRSRLASKAGIAGLDGVWSSLSPTTSSGEDSAQQSSDDSATEVESEDGNGWDSLEEGSGEWLGSEDSMVYSGSD